MHPTRPRAAVLYEHSGVMRTALDAVGYDAWSIDLIDSDHPQHLVADLDDTDPSDLLGALAFVVALPPCTDLASSGARWWERKRADDPDFQRRAARRATVVETWGAPAIIENPVGAVDDLAQAGSLRRPL